MLDQALAANGIVLLSVSGLAGANFLYDRGASDSLPRRAAHVLGGAAFLIAALWLDDPRWPLVFGWLAIWGWAGMIVHGMLTRIVPFLVWFHRFAALVGLEPVPPMRRMLPVGRATVAYWLHALTLVLGCGAIISGWVPLVYAAALTMALTGLALGACLLGVLAARAG